MIELNGETYLDGSEACHLLGVKVSTLYTYVSRGILKSYKQGIKRQRLYKRAELEALLQLRPLYKRAELEALLQLRPSTHPSPAADFEQTGDAGADRPDIPAAEDWVPNV